MKPSRTNRPPSAISRRWASIVTITVALRIRRVPILLPFETIKKPWVKPPGSLPPCANPDTSQHIGVERMSFLDALRWLGPPSTGIPLYALIVNPIRPHRLKPRVKKWRPKSFLFMVKPRQELRQQLVQQEHEA